jgi:diguanylate cyclase (GGDEF)-like protein/PAS domain S-box-containing protein
MPSMRDLTEPSGQSAGDTGPNRIIWMASAALIAPAVLYLEWLNASGTARDAVDDTPVIAAAAAVMFLLVLVRVNGLATAQRQARARERALRKAGAALFAAATVADVIEATRAAVSSLIPDGQAHLVVFTDATEGWPASGTRHVTAAELPPGVEAGDFDAFVYGTLPLPGRDGQLLGGLVGTSAPVLRELAGSLEALYGQVQVVLQRIALTGEVNRRDSEAYFRTLIQNASDVILIIGDDDRIRYASPSAESVLGYPDLAGTPLSALIAAGHHDALGRVLAEVRAGSEHLDVPDLGVVRADGALVQVECTGRDLRADPTVAGLVLTVRDVTERRRLAEDLSRLAFHDGLTGLANRVQFRNRLELAYTAAARDESTLAVLFVDLDDFKEVNDTLGHAVGDQLLVTVGKRIAELTGDGGTAARMGGDEFAILLEPSHDATAAEQMAARLVAALAVPVEVSDGIGGTHIVSAASSVGIATNGDADNATELLRHADLALYQAKGDTKGTWQRYRPELHHAMVRRLEIRAALHEGIDNEQFVPMFQPIVDLETGLVRGVEALVRWQHPARGLLGPYHFIEVAEESGAIVAIGASVLRQALAQFAAWKAADPDSTLRYVSVNVSPRQFRTPGFVDQVREALAEAGVDPAALLLEITEGLVLHDAEQVWDDLRELRAMGIRIAIDDFGTGYSSLSYLRQMPVDVLKLDKSFIDDILTSEQQHTMVDAIVTLARNLDLTVIAEGVEDAGQRAALTAMSCPYGQGYLFAKPVWPAEIAEMARSTPALV